jgi:hypothetical protein
MSRHHVGILPGNWNACLASAIDPNGFLFRAFSFQVRFPSLSYTYEKDFFHEPRGEPLLGHLRGTSIRPRREAAIDHG